jgi:hypothetical protein
MKFLEKIIKYFPLLPEEKNTGKLVLALLFYVYVPFLATAIVGGILGATIILIPAANILSVAGTLYAIAGILLSLKNYLNIEIGCCKE